MSVKFFSVNNILTNLFQITNFFNKNKEINNTQIHSLALFNLT
jgi:hypothetical protein